MTKSDLNALARDFGMESLSSVSDDMLDPELVADLPLEWARTHCLLPARIAGEMCVLTADPGQVSEQEYLELLLGKELRPVLAEREVILRSIERCYYSKKDSPREFLRDLAQQESEAGAPPSSASGVGRRGTDDLLQTAEKAPVTQLVNLILLEAVKRRASDIHFEPFEANLRVRYRIDGILYEQTSPPKHLEEALTSRLKVMAHMDIAEKRLPQDGTARVRVGEREIDVRVSTIPVAEGERVVLRLLDRNSALLPLDALGMAKQTLRSFELLLARPNGVIVVCGPTGSGKTTTLYAALRQFDATRKNILTIEDPIEYHLPDIGQIQVKPKIGLTFADGLRHILRQDPDIILVGETRDIETAQIAIRASLTGHLVFTTLHTNDAAGAVLRLVDMGVEPYLLASSMRGVLAQRLVRKLCPECRTMSVVSPEQAAALGPAAKLLKDGNIWLPAGCPACLEGYAGRIGLFELMVMDGQAEDLIRTGLAGSDKLRASAGRNGMESLFEDGINKASRGTTSLTEVMSVVN